jgi:hypothetical protein
VTELPPELLQQLQTIVSDLAVLRHTVEEIASKQEQTSRDIASIQAAEQNISKQIASLRLLIFGGAEEFLDASQPHAEPEPGRRISLIMVPAQRSRASKLIWSGC